MARGRRVSRGSAIRARNARLRMKWSLELAESPPLREVVVDGIQQAALDVMPTVREQVPLGDTGDTRANFYPEHTKGGSTINNALPYAAYVHFPGESPASLKNIPIAFNAQIDREMSARADAIGNAVLGEIFDPSEWNHGG